MNIMGIIVPDFLDEVLCHILFDLERAICACLCCPAKKGMQVRWNALAVAPE